MKSAIRALLWAGCSVAVTANAQNAGSPAVDAAQQAAQASRAAQNKIDQLDDQTRQLLERYRAAVWQGQQLNIYVQQVEPLLATQDAEKQRLASQARDIEGTSRDILPLMLRMVDSFDKFVALDLPFLQAERRERSEGLKRLMADPATPLAEKYRRILEAYRVEGDYGRSFGAERMELTLGSSKKVVDVLHVGRLALLYLSLDGAETGWWDSGAKQWKSFGGEHRAAIREALKIAREAAAPELVVLPVPAPGGGAAAASARASVWRPAFDLLAALVPAARAAPPQGLDQLLGQIRETVQADARINAERERRFLGNRDQQQAQAAQAEAELKSAEARAGAVRARYEAGNRELAALKQQLSAQTGDLSQVYAAVRETAAELRGIAAESYLSAQFPERLELLARLSAPDALPSARQLEQFWFVLAQEMTENGKVARFDAELIGPDGAPHKTQVTRAGVFAAVADGDYLIMQDGHLTVPARRTAKAGLARAFEQAGGGGWTRLALDPTRGNLLRLEAQRPRLIERIQQGGLVGYTIIVVGLVGLTLAVFQLWYLATVGARMTRQLRDIAAPRADNPLGRVLSCLRDDGVTHDPEVLETRLSEAVLRETPSLERFQPFLRMVVAAGPLLGLVGTVTGMIVTFQVITEVGAGDPKVMAGGISQAMVSTVLGLLIAIPILFINSVLQARSRVLVQILDEQSAGLLARTLEARRAP